MNRRRWRRGERSRLGKVSVERRAVVIVLGNENGGSGKSTTALHLIVGLLRDGYCVGAIDLDARQATLSGYILAREALARAKGVPLPMRTDRLDRHAQPDGDDCAAQQARRQRNDRCSREARSAFVRSRALASG
ncbi:MAG: division plane positioning ATPase MipZ [Acetobacteraceae bacterium]